MTARLNLAELFEDRGSLAPAVVATSPLAIVSYKALADQIERLVANIALMIVANYANRLADLKIDFPVVQTQLEFAGFQGKGASLCLYFRTLQFAHTRKGTPQ
jgi:hypothetical protein